MGKIVMAKFNIQNFVSELNKSGTLQTNKYEVFFSSPLVMQNVKIDGVSTSDTERLMNLRAESVKIPGIGLLMSDVNRYGVGPMQKMPYNAAFTSNAITFLTDKKNNIHKYFYTWMNCIFDFSGTPLGTINQTTQSLSNGQSYKTEYKDNYTTDLHVRLYDVTGAAVQEIVMYKAFPEALNDVNLGWNDNNNLIKVIVSFSFRDWAMVNLNQTKNTTVTTPVTVREDAQYDAMGNVTIPGFAVTTTSGGSTNSSRLPVIQTNP
jgi:hypothetical protein